MKHLITRALVLVAVLGANSGIRAQSFSPFSSFLNMSQAQLATLEAKLTYGGIQDEPVATVVITGPSATLNVSQFNPFHRSSFSYTNDTISVKQIAASTSDLAAMLQSVNAISAVQSGSVESPAYVSFSLVNPVSGQTLGFEAILNPTDGVTLMNAIQSAFQDNSAALVTLSDFACATALQSATVPFDLSTVISVTLSGVRLNHANGHFVGTATLKNNAATAIPLPLSLVLALPEGVTLFDAMGLTCAVPPVARAYINAPLSGPLNPGASVQINLDYLNPNALPITTPTQVLAGPGAR
jgi:hypothetical protein